MVKASVKKVDGVLRGSYGRESSESVGGRQQQVVKWWLGQQIGGPTDVENLLASMTYREFGSKGRRWYSECAMLEFAFILWVQLYETI